MRVDSSRTVGGNVIKVHVASTSSVGRKGLEALVRASDSLALVGTSTAWETLAQDIEDSQPDVLLAQTDRHYEDSTPEWLEILEGGARRQSSSIVLLVDGPHTPDLARAFRSSLDGILPLDIAETEIVAAIKAVAAGLVVLHPAFLDLLTELRTPKPDCAGPRQ
jgi:DNA-binding NarL/FixJ family response regulator